MAFVDHLANVRNWARDISNAHSFILIITITNIYLVPVPYQSRIVTLSPQNIFPLIAYSLFPFRWYGNWRWGDQVSWSTCFRWEPDQAQNPLLQCLIMETLVFVFVFCFFAFIFILLISQLGVLWPSYYSIEIVLIKVSSDLPFNDQIQIFFSS